MPSYENNDELLLAILNFSSDDLVHFMQLYLNNALRQKDTPRELRDLDRLENFLGSESYVSHKMGDKLRDCFNDQERFNLFFKIMKGVLHNSDLKKLILNQMTQDIPLAQRMVEAHHLPEKDRVLFYGAGSSFPHTNYAGIEHAINAGKGDISLFEHIKKSMEKEDELQNYSRFSSLHENEWCVDLVQKEAIKTLTYLEIKNLLTNQVRGTVLSKSCCKLLDFQSRNCINALVNFIRKRDRVEFQNESFNNFFDMLLHTVIDKHGFNANKIKIIVKCMDVIQSVYQNNHIANEDVIDFTKMMRNIVEHDIRNVKNKIGLKIVGVERERDEHGERHSESVVDGIVDVMNQYGIKKSDMEQFFQLTSSCLKVPTKMGKKIRELDSSIVASGEYRDTSYYLKIRNFLSCLDMSDDEIVDFSPDLENVFFKFVADDKLDLTDKKKVKEVVKVMEDEWKLLPEKDKDYNFLNKLFDKVVSDGKCEDLRKSNIPKNTNLKQSDKVVTSNNPWLKNILLTHQNPRNSHDKNQGGRNL